MTAHTIIRPQIVSDCTTPSKLRRIQLRNAGDWSGDMAMRAWAEGDEDTYCRLIRQADRLWTMAGKVTRS